MRDLKGKTAVVTGGGSGIGLGIVKLLAAEGMKVAFTDIRQDHLDAAVAYFADRPDQVVLPVQLDVTDRQGFVGAREVIERELGHVQLLVNNAGVMVSGLIENATYAEWDWVLDVNLGGVINGLTTFLPGMIARGEPGHIVNTASMGGLYAVGPTGVYVTSKFAVVGLSEALRTDMVGREIGVSVLCPGSAKTNLAQSSASRSLRHGGPVEVSLSDELSSVTDTAMEPTEIGRHVVEGIKENRLYILTHPEFAEIVKARHAKIERSFSRDSVDQARAQSSSFLLSNPVYDHDS